MIKSALFIALLSMPHLAGATPIEGGGDISYSNFDYIDIVKIDMPNGSSCSATKVSSKLVLTAAHCVVDYQENQFSQRFGPGQNIMGLGKIISVSVHPKYQEIALKKNLTKDLNLKTQLQTKATLYDIAFIQIEERKSARALPYPKIISEETKFNQRKKMELVGHGANEVYWNGDNFDYNHNKRNIQKGNNEWSQCPLDYFGNEILALEKFKNDLEEQLQIKSKRIHTISDGSEQIETFGTGMILAGDSGSPAIERDQDNRLVVTGVASNISPFVSSESGNAELVILVKDKVIYQKVFEKMPENWGQKTKFDAEFPEIENALREKGLVDSYGSKRPDIVVKRKYTRTTSGNYADLSHPENQKFIKEVFSK